MNLSSNFTTKKRVLYGALLLALLLAAPLLGRALGTTWGAIHAYRTALAMFHNREIALKITARVFDDAYRSYLYGR